MFIPGERHRLDAALALNPDPDFSINLRTLVYDPTFNSSPTDSYSELRTKRFLAGLSLMLREEMRIRVQTPNEAHVYTQLAVLRRFIIADTALQDLRIDAVTQRLRDLQVSLRVAEFQQLTSAAHSENFGTPLQPYFNIASIAQVIANVTGEIAALQTQLVMVLQQRLTCAETLDRFRRQPLQDVATRSYGRRLLRLGHEASIDLLAAEYPSSDHAH